MQKTRNSVWNASPGCSLPCPPIPAWKIFPAPFSAPPMNSAALAFLLMTTALSWSSAPSRTPPPTSPNSPSSTNVEKNPPQSHRATEKRRAEKVKVEQSLKNRKPNANPSSARTEGQRVIPSAHKTCHPERTATNLSSRAKSRDLSSLSFPRASASPRENLSSLSSLRVSVTLWWTFPAFVSARLRQAPRSPQSPPATAPDSSAAAATSPAARQTPENFSSKQDPKAANPISPNSCIALFAKFGNPDAAQWKARCFPPIRWSCRFPRARRRAQTSSTNADTSFRIRSSAQSGPYFLRRLWCPQTPRGRCQWSVPAFPLALRNPFPDAPGTLSKSDGTAPY